MKGRLSFKLSGLWSSSVSSVLLEGKEDNAVLLTSCKLCTLFVGAPEELNLLHVMNCGNHFVLYARKILPYCALNYSYNQSSLHLCPLLLVILCMHISCRYNPYISVCLLQISGYSQHLTFLTTWNVCLYFIPVISSRSLEWIAIMCLGYKGSLDALFHPLQMAKVWEDESYSCEQSKKDPWGSVIPVPCIYS